MKVCIVANVLSSEIMFFLSLGVKLVFLTSEKGSPSIRFQSLLRNTELKDNLVIIS